MYTIIDDEAPKLTTGNYKYLVTDDAPAPANKPAAGDQLEQAFAPYADFGSGFYRGVQDITDTLVKGGSRAVDFVSKTAGNPTNTAKTVDDAIKHNQQQYQNEVGDSNAANVGQVGGQIFGTLPLTALKVMQGAGMGAQMANGAIQGGAAGAATSSAYDSPAEIQAGIGATVGALAPPAVRGVARAAAPLVDMAKGTYSNIANKITGASNAVSQFGDDIGAIRRALQSGNPAAQGALAIHLEKQLDRIGVDYKALMPEAQTSLLADAEKSLRLTGKLSPDMLARNADMVALGIKPTAGSLTRDPRVWQFEQNTAGVPGEAGDKLTQRFVENNRAIAESLEKLKGKTGGVAATPYEAGEGGVEATLAKYKEMQQEIGAQYKIIKEAKGNDIGLQPKTLFKTIEDNIDNADADSLMDSIRRKMTRYGLVDEKGIPKDNAFLTVENAEELRKFIGGLSDKGDPSIKRIKGLIIDSLDDDVINTAGDDAYKSARDASRARFQEFSPKPLKGITDGKTVADDVLQRNVLSAKVADVAAFKKSLTTGTPDQVARGGQAWNDLRLQTMQHIIDQSTDAGGKIQGSRLAKALDGLGKERLEVIFSKEELSHLGTIKRAAYNTTVAVPESRVNYSGTGAFLADLMGRAGIGKNVVKVANAATNVPVIGTALSPVTGLMKMSGDMIDSAATSSAVGKTLQASPTGMQQILVNDSREAAIAKLLADSPVSQTGVALANSLRKRSQ